jgi:hypothetical protein
MLRRDFIHKMTMAGAAIAAAPVPVFSQQTKAAPVHRVYGTKAMLDNLPAFSKDNLGEWAGADVIPITKNDVVFNGNIPVGVSQEFLAVLKELKIDPAEFFRIPEYRGDIKRNRPASQVLASSVISGEYRARGFSRLNPADNNPKNWDVLLIIAPDVTIDPKQNLALVTRVQPQFLEANIRPEMLVNVILAHEARHMFLRTQGLLEVAGLYCEADGKCHDENGLYGKAGNRKYMSIEQIMAPLKNMTGLVALTPLQQQARSAQQSMANQNEYYCDQFAINVCLPAGLTPQEAMVYKNARAIGAFSMRDHHVTVLQLDVRGKALDPAALSALVLTDRDPLKVMERVRSKLSNYLAQELNLKGMDVVNEIENSTMFYRRLSEMVAKGKFENALEHELVELFLQGGNQLAPSIFSTQIAALGNVYHPIPG